MLIDVDEHFCRTWETLVEVDEGFRSAWETLIGVDEHFHPVWETLVNIAEAIPAAQKYESQQPNVRLNNMGNARRRR